MRRAGTTLFVLLTVTVAFSARGADWPAWRHDAGRSAYAPEDLPPELQLLWEKTYTPRKVAWEEPLNRDRMPFDRVFEPVAADGILFIGFNDSDKLVALDAATGEERWTFYTNGPVRLPPTVSAGRVYVASDDGFLYCLDTQNGSLAWKHRGGPSDRKLLGNGRLISTWPARGGPVLVDNVVYYAAGIWPFMGIFIYALDAETGRVIWENDGTGPQFQLQPHNAGSFAGVAPQGAFAVDGDRLLVPGGRSVPACFDRGSGVLLHYSFAENNKTGGSFLCTADGMFLSHHRDKVVSLYDVESGKKLADAVGSNPVLAGSTWCFTGPVVIGVSSEALRSNPQKLAENKLWECPVDASGDLIGAGTRLYAAGKGRITAFVVPLPGGSPEIAWAKTIRGDVERLLAADGRLFAVTLDGRILAFGVGTPTARTGGLPPAAAEPPTAAFKQAQAILETTGVRDGYALVYGGAERLSEALAVQSNLHIIDVQSDGNEMAMIRTKLDAAGLYGTRVAVHGGDPDRFEAPLYMASLTVVSGLGAASDVAPKRIFSSMRPYDGRAIFLDPSDEERLALREAAAEFAGVKLEDIGSNVVVTRQGPLEGSGSWTHILGDVAQTGKSNDARVKAPLGILWFGGNTNEDVLPRHGHGPTEQVIGGRLFIEGMNCLSARDVYTGRVLWKKTLQDLGNDEVYFSGDSDLDPTYNQSHIPGANVRGTNYVATLDSVYIVQKGVCNVIDAASGQTRLLIPLPAKDPNAKKPELPDWGYIGVYDDLLIGGADFVESTDLLQVGREEAQPWSLLDKASDRKLVAMDRKSGELKWVKDAVHGFLHNGIVAGGNSLFCLDKLPPGIEDQLERRGKSAPQDHRIMALDIRTGETRWEKSGPDVFGSFLSYATAEDILLQSSRPSRDSGPGEVGKRMAAYRGQDGTLLWDREFPYGTFPVIHGRQLITESGAFELATGDPVMRPNPLTAVAEPWVWKRNYGCNYPIASENLITFRSGAAGFFDFANDGGTGNLGGFKSGCTANLVAADGVLNAPDYTRTCVCSYQNQTSLALVHMPEAEMWTFNAFEAGTGRITRVGINLGAPGDRRADDGTLWLDYPSVGGLSPDLNVTVTPEKAKWFHHHSSRIQGEGLNWVAASGLEGSTTLSIPLAPGATDECSYTIRLYFAEPDDVPAGQRVFDVMVQGSKRISNLDIVTEAGGARRSLVKELRGVRVRDVLGIALGKSAPEIRLEPLLCGIEAVLEMGPATAKLTP